MTKKYYKKIIDTHLVVSSKPSPLHTLVLWKSDPEISCEDKQELRAYLSKIIIDNLKKEISI